MREETVSSSFHYVLPGEIVQASLTDELTSEHADSRNKNGIETRAVAWSPDCRYFAWSCGKGYVILCPWNHTKNRIYPDKEPKLPRHRIDCGEFVWSLAFSTTPTIDLKSTKIISTRPWQINKYLVLAVGVSSGRIQLWNVHSGTLLLYLRDHSKLVRCLCFAPNGSQILVSGSNDGSLKFWDLNDRGNMTHTLRTPLNSIIYSCKFSSHVKYLAATGANRLVMVWNMENKSEPYRKFVGHQNDVVSCDFSPDGALLATASHDTRVIIWDINKGESIKQLGHLFPSPRPIFAGGANEYYVRSVAFSNLGSYIVTVADDGYVRLWNLLSFNDDPEMIADLKNGLCCGFSPNNGSIAVGTRSGNVCFFKAEQKLPPLQHLCRGVIRSNIPQNAIVNSLKIPHRFKKYLAYEEW